MRLVLPVLMVLFISTNAIAQGGGKWNIFAGPQASSALYKVNDSKQPNSYKIDFLAGVGLKVPIENTISFSPQAFYSMKGYKVNLKQSQYPPDPAATSNDTRIHSFELAFLLQFDFNPEPGHMFFRTGPTLDFQLAGHEKFRTATAEVSRSMKYGYGDYGRYAANWLLHLGYETPNGFFIYGHYTYGLTNLSNVDEGPKIRHLAAGITFGMFLKRNKVE